MSQKSRLFPAPSQTDNNEFRQFIPFMDEYEIKSILCCFDLFENSVKALEWGSGNSSIYFSSKLPPGSTWDSVEHNLQWANKVKNLLNELAIKNVHLHYVPNNCEFVTGDDGTYESFRDYILFPTKLGKKFQLIVVDGRGRVECMQIGWMLLEDAGVMILHDAQRTMYDRGIPPDCFYLRIVNTRIDCEGNISTLFMSKSANIISKIEDSIQKILPEYINTFSGLAGTSFTEARKKMVMGPNHPGTNLLLKKAQGGPLEGGKLLAQGIAELRSGEPGRKAEELANHQLGDNQFSSGFVSDAGWKLTPKGLIKKGFQQTNDPEVEAIQLCQKAVDKLRQNEPSEALKILDEAQHKSQAEKLAIAGLQTIRAACLLKSGRLDEAVSAAEAELSLQPGNKDCQRILELTNRIRKKIKKPEPTKLNNCTNRPCSLAITWEQVKQMPVIRLYAGDVHKQKEYEGLIGLSLSRNDQNHLRHDITQPFPLMDNSVDSFQAEDVLEHIPYEKLVPVINEIYRVLKPDGLFRLSVPDYGCDVLQNRSIKDEKGQIVFDPGGGGTPENPGHVWFPRIDTVMQLLTKTKFHESGKIELLHYYNKDGTFAAKPIDYSKGHVRRTPDFDERVKNPYRPMSLVINLIKGRAIASQNCRTKPEIWSHSVPANKTNSSPIWCSERQNQYTQSRLTENSLALSANQQVSHSTPSCSAVGLFDAEPSEPGRIYILPVHQQFQPTSMPARYPGHNDFYGVEQDFLLFLQNHKELITHDWQEAKWHYLPVFWTHWLVSHDYGKRDLDKLQHEVNRCILDDSRTFTICQYADGPLVDIGLTSVFLSSRNTERGIDIPCLCAPHKKPSRLPVKKYLASFVGRLSTGEVRRQMAENLKGHSDILITDRSEGTDYFAQTMLESYIALSPRGYGGGSFRFYEAMQLGTVPFLIGNIDTRAFKDFINWDEVSFYAPDASDIAVRLRRMNKQQLLEMGAKAAKVWAEELSYQNWCRYVIKELQSHSNPITGFKVHKLKNLETIGTDYGKWTIPKGFLTRESICYCAGAGEDISFDVGIANQYGCNVHIFDPTPRAITHFNQLQDRTIKGEKTPINNNTTDFYDLTPNTLRKLHFSPTGIWDKETSIKFYAPKNPQHVSHSILNLQKTDSFFEAKVNRLSNIMRKLKHNRIDLLKLDIEGAEYKVIDSIIDDNLDIKVLCIEFDEAFNKLDEGYLTRIKNHLLKLKDFGFVIGDVSRHHHYMLIKRDVYKSLMAENQLRMQTAQCSTDDGERKKAGYYELTPKDASCPVCYCKKAHLLYTVDGQQATRHFVLKEVDEQRFLKLRSHINTFWQYHTCDVVRCTECGFCFPDPYVAGDGRFYALAYENPSYPSWKWEFHLTYEVLRDMVRYGNLRNFKLLEVGAGDGAFVKRIAPGLTLKENILCTEYSDDGRREISRYGIPCVSEDVRNLNSDISKGYYDVICMFQVLEHMVDIDALFKHLSWLSHKNTSLFIAVPNHKRIEFNEQNGALLDMPPNHVGRWNRLCFEIIGKRHGWSVVRYEIETESFESQAQRFASYRYLRQSQEHGTIPNQIEQISDKAQRSHLQKLEKEKIHSQMSQTVINALRSNELGCSQWVHMIKNNYETPCRVEKDYSMSHFLSFIIPCYNCADTVGEAIESIYQQTLDIPFEVICTDDSSGDSTRQVLAYYQKKRPNLHVHYHDQNRGGAAARNTCVANSRGDLIFCLDSDNILVPDSVSKLIKLLDETGCDGAAVAELRYFEGSKGNYRYSHSWFYEAPNNICDISHILSTTMTPAASGNYLYTRKSFDRAGGYPEGNSLDTLGFGFRQHATGGEIAILPGTFYWHRLSSNSYWMREQRKGSHDKNAANIFREFPELFTDETNCFLASPDCEKDFFKHLKSGRFKAVPKQSLAYLFQGYREQLDRKYSEAVNSFSRAISFGCKHWKVVGCLSQAAYNAGNMNLAKQAAGAVTELAPEFIKAQQFLSLQDGISSALQIKNTPNDLPKLESCVLKQADVAEFDNMPSINPVSEEPKQRYARMLKGRIKQLGTATTVSSSKTEATWVKHRNNIQRLILNEDVNNFLNWDTIVGTMFHEARIEELQFLQSLPDWNRWQKAIQESFVGNPRPYPEYPESSGNLIHHAYSLAQLEQRSGCRIELLSKIVEFGGGYGSMCRLAFQLGFKGRYIIYDLPELTALQEYFLNCIGLERYVSYDATSNAPTAIILLSDINKLTEQLNYKAAGYAFIATWSISEVPLELRNRIFNLVSGADYYLIAYQDQFGKVDNLNYFTSLAKSRPDFAWKGYPIAHLPSNHYLIGRKKSLHITKPDNDESGTPHSAGLINGVIFSKDRAMQLDATIRSFLLNCKDHHFVNLKVIYKVSNSYHKESYNKLIKEYKFIEFIEEEDFRKQLLSNLAHSKYVLFLVDDNIFVRDFRLSEIAEVLQKNSDALGFSLRLGKNINYHYPSSSKETTLPFIDVTGKVLEYDWTGKNRYFGYPLEVSSSVYRTDDILPLLTKLDFQGPNTLEAEIARSKNAFANSKKNLLCFQQSVTFCNPVNVVQDVFPDNRSGNKREYSPDSLARMFNAGYRIDVAKFLNFIPSSCHQEVQFEFIKSNSESSGPGYNCPTVSIYMAVYNSEKYLAQTLDSILSQTFRDFEIVIAEDGSMDNSAEILKRYEKADSRIRILQLPHVGVVEARNEAIKRCNPNSKYLMNHDSDDMSSPTKLARLVEYIETHPEIAIVGCFAEYFDDEGNFKGKPPIEWLPERIRQTFGEVNSMIHSASLIRRQVFEKIGSYSKDFLVTQDFDFFARALMAGFELANIPEVLHKIRLHPKSIGNAHAASVKIATDRVQKNYKSHQQMHHMQVRENSNWSLSTSHTEKSSYPQFDGEETVNQQSVEGHPKREHKENPTQELLGQDFVVSHNVNFKVAELLSADSHIAVSNRQDEIWNYLSKNPKDGFGHLWIGLILWWQGKYKEACKEFEMAESLDVPQWRTSWYRSLAIRDDSENWGWRNYELARKLVSKVLDAVPMFDGALTYQLYLNGYYSQWGQDTLVEDFFRFNKPRSRIFVDVGAYDGITLSNTKRLFDIGWSGVCVEPVSSNFQKLEALYAGTDVKCVQKAISFKEGVVNISVAGTGSAIVDKPGATTEQIRSCKLTKVLDQLHIRDVDFLSIDAEEVDFEVLQSLDFGRFRPQLIVIEYNSSKEEREQISAFMRERDYVLWHDNVQDVFFRTSETVEPPNFWLIKTLEPKRPNMRNSTGQKVDKRQVRTADKSKSFSILHTVELYSPHVGGAELVVQQLSERLAKRGHNVTVATTRLAERTFDQLNGVQIEEFDVWGSIARGFTGSDIARYQQFLLKHPADIMMNYAAQQWATDLAFDTLASTSNRRVNIIAPCGYSALSDSKTLQMPQFADYFNRVIPAYLPKYDAAVYHSGLYQDYEFAQNHGFKNSVIIPNGVCEEEFSQPPKVSFRQKYKIATKYLGLCVANFYPGKGQEKIIECARQMNRPDFTMVFIGKESSELCKLQQLASGLNVRFCVGIEREDTLAAYHEADIFLFGSEKECSPLVIVEAKASRTPFVSTDCGNVREWKGGVVCASEKMAFYANRILDEEVTRKNLAEEGWKDWKEKLTLKSVVDRYEELYLRLHWKKSGSRTKSQLQMPNAKISKGSQKKNEKQAKEDITALIFSKDRALQLQATIESFLLHCQDEDSIDLVVLYKASNELHGGQYTELKKKFSGIDFVEESNFREQVLSAIEKCDYILFLVDDNIFVKPFSMKDITKALQREKDAVGFSLRLGKNTNYCYPFSSKQALPQFKKFSKGILKYYWPDAEYDFGYPLEVSSSVYRCQDMLQLLNRKEFVNPNTLESLMNQNKNLYNSLPYLLTYEESVTFANPVNIVQNVYENKHGTINNYTSEELADCFSQGMAVDVEQYIGLTPNAAHQEAELYFIGPSISSTAKAEDVVEISGMKPIEQYPDSKPKFSIIMANYNNENYIAEAIESVLDQTFRNWELIIIEDCSTDNSLQIIKRYLNDRRIRLIQHYQNRGYVAALKTGIENVRSEYFGILDSDDCLTSSAIETMYSYHVRFPDCGLIYSQFVFCHEDLTPRNIGFCAEIPADKTNLDADVVSHFKTLKLRDYLKTSGYDEDILYAEDKDIFYKMEEVAKLKFVDQCLYLYRELPNSQGHDPVKASIGRQSRQRARLNALRRRGLIPMEAKQQKSESVVLEQFAIGDRYALGSSYLKVGRYSEAQAAFESILTSLTQTLKLGKSQLSGRKLENYNNMAQFYLSSSTKLAQCYMKQGKYDKVKQICTHLLNNQYLDLPEEQKASIHSVLAKLESIKLPAVSSTGNSPRNPFWGQEEPLVSVYVVTYNMERFIRQAIDSVLAQTYQNLELLIVDDGSTDATKDIVASYSDDRIRYIYKPHKNFASGMNVAISKAKGKYLTGVDSDDFIATDYIEKLLTCARKHPEIDYFYPAKLVLVDESGNPTGVVWDYLDFSDNSALPAFLFGNGYSPIPNSPSLKRKSLFGKVGLYEELDTVEDFVFLCKNALRISFKRVEEHSTYFYRRTLEGNCYKFKARNQITAQALNDMVSMYPAEVLYPQIAGINDPALREQQYYKYLMTTFYKHVNGHMVRYGEYFQQYGDYYKEKLLDHMAKVDKALSSVDGASAQDDLLSSFKQGVEHLKKAHPQDALACLDKTCYLGGKLSNLQYARAVALMQLGKWNDARLACEAELAIQPDHRGTQMLLEKISENASAIN